MSLQHLLANANPFYLLALTLLFLLFLFLRRDRSTHVQSERPSHHAQATHGAVSARDDNGTVRATAGVAATTAAATAVAHAVQGTAGHAASQSTAETHFSGATTASVASNVADEAAGRIRVPGIDYDFTDDTLRRHNRYHAGYSGSAVGVGSGALGTAAAAAVATAGTHKTGAARDAISHDDVGAARANVPDAYRYEEKGRSWVFPVVAALTAALVSCQVATDRGVLGTLADLFGGSRPAPIVAKIEAKVPSAEELKAKAEAAKAKVEEAAAAAKAKVTAVAEKAVEAAKIEPKPEPKPAPVEVKPEPKPAAVVDVAAPLPPPVPGVTHYYGITDSVVGAPFSAAAKFNPDYQVAAAPAPAPVEAAKPAPVVDVAPAMTPPGLTSYFGLAERPDSDQMWAAAARMNPDYKVEATPAPAPAAPPKAEPVVEAPLAMTPPGLTSYFGLAEKPDSSFAWAAAARMNPNYTVAAAPKPAAPVTPEVIETCRDALNAEATAGKINFATSSFEILPDSYKTLDTIAKMAKDCGGVIIEVGGHTDSTGKPASNKTLSELRAKAVVRYLTGAGVDAGKLRAVGYGQDRPVASNDTDAGKRQNRRIEFLVTAP